MVRPGRISRLRRRVRGRARGAPRRRTGRSGAGRSYSSGAAGSPVSASDEFEEEQRRTPNFRRPRGLPRGVARKRCERLHRPGRPKRQSERRPPGQWPSLETRELLLEMRRRRADLPRRLRVGVVARPREQRPSYPLFARLVSPGGSLTAARAARDLHPPTHSSSGGKHQPRASEANSSTSRSRTGTRSRRRPAEATPTHRCASPGYSG